MVVYSTCMWPNEPSPNIRTPDPDGSDRDFFVLTVHELMFFVSLVSTLRSV